MLFVIIHRVLASLKFCAQGEYLTLLTSVLAISFHSEGEDDGCWVGTWKLLLRKTYLLLIQVLNPLAVVK